jgi:hypothetical protein
MGDSSCTIAKDDSVFLNHGIRDSSCNVAFQPRSLPELGNMRGGALEVPLENKRNFLEVSGDIVERVDPVFFSDPMTAAMKALGMT